MKKTPDKAQLTILTQERLSPERIGAEIAVKILDSKGAPISGYPFQVNAEHELLLEGMTDEHGEYRGQRVISIRENTQKKVFLTLEDSPVTDWKEVGQAIPEGPFVVRTGVRVEDPSGRPVPDFPFSVRVEDSSPVEAVTNKSGEFRNESQLDPRALARREVFLTLKVARVLPEESTAPDDLLCKVLTGKRSILRGEEFHIEKGKHRVTKDIVVEEGAALVIAPGTVLEFLPGSGILCEGLLKAIGTKKDPITFKPAADRWGNITLMGMGTQLSQLEYCVIEGATGRTVSWGNPVVRPFPYDQNGNPVGPASGGALLFLSIDPEFDNVDLNKVPTLKDIVLRNNRADLLGIISCYRSSIKVDGCEVTTKEDHNETMGWAISSSESFALDLRNIKIFAKRAIRENAVFYGSRHILGFKLENCMVRLEVDIGAETTLAEQKKREQIAEIESKENSEAVAKVVGISVGVLVGGTVLVLAFSVIIPILIVAGGLYIVLEILKAIAENEQR